MKHEPDDFHPLAPPKERDRYSSQFAYDTRYLPLYLILSPFAVMLLCAILYELGLFGLQPS